MQDVLENVFAQRETQTDPWRKQWLSVENYGLVRAAEDMMYDLQIVAIFYSRLLKKASPPKLSLKKNKVEKVCMWADIWRSANSVTQIRKWRANCDPCTTTVVISDDRHPHEWPPRLEF